MKRVLALLFVFSFFFYPAISRADARFSHDRMKTVVRDAEAFYSAPLRWRAQDWFHLVLFAGGTAVLSLQDEPVQRWVQRRRNRYTDALSGGVRWFGDGRITLPLLAAGWMIASRRGNSRLAWACLSAMESFFLANSLTMGGKFLFHRSRPYLGRGARVWGGPSLDRDNGHLSMPSGHTSSAFSVASALAFSYRDRPLVWLPAMLLAALTGWSRVNDNKHWFSDVWAGAFFGVMTARFLEKRHSQTGKTARGENVGVAVVRNTVVFRVRLRF